MFVTLEDETGATNVIVWRDLGDRQRRELLGARLMAVYGKVEREGAVVHVVAGRLVDLSPLLGALTRPNRAAVFTEGRAACPGITRFRTRSTARAAPSPRRSSRYPAARRRFSPQ